MGGMFGGTDVLLPAALATATKAYFAADPAARGITYDLANDDGSLPFGVSPAGRYAAVVRKPTGFYVLGGYATAALAAHYVDKFWTGMADLLRPA